MLSNSTAGLGYGEDSEELKALWEKINQADAENLETVEKLIAEHGWIGGQRFGAGGSAIFLVLQHADLKIQEKYFPLLEKAVESGAATKGQLALMTDRINVRKNLTQIYGSQLLKNEKGIYYLAPIENVSRVNLLRSQMGLESMEKYLKKYGMNWQVEKANMKIYDQQESN